MVEGLNSLPIQFATSVDQTQWAQKYSGFAPNAAEALKNLQKSVKKAVRAFHVYYLANIGPQIFFS